MKKLMLFFAAMIACTACCSNECCTESKEEVKNVIYMIGDGMGLAHVSMLKVEENYAPTAFDRAENVALITTHSSNNRVTDSAAAGTALATGVKARNDQLGLDVNEQPHASLADIAREQGYKSAIVSNVAANHATPTVFFVHQSNRKDYEDVTRQTIECKVNFLAGSSIIDEKDNAPFGERWIENAKQEGWEVFRSASEAAATSAAE